MDIGRPLRLLPTLPMLYECLTEAGWDCAMTLSEESQHYQEIRLYHRKQTLRKDVLYLLRPTERDFPVDDYAYLSAGDLPGRANHLRCPNLPDEEILDQLLEIFSRFRDWEDQIDGLLYRNASLQELCELGAEILENPVWIHDDWFVMMAMSGELSQIMEPEYLMSSARGFVPRAVVEDFQNDSEYLETYTHRRARIWYAEERDHASLYVNLWEGPVYKGRLLVARKNREFCLRDFMVAEALTQRAMMLLRRKGLGDGEQHQNMDDIVYALLQGRQPEQTEMSYLMNMLQWQHTDRFLCVRLRPQQSEGTSITDHLIHSDLFSVFQKSYILLEGQEQCVVLNLSGNPLSLGQVRHLLAPLCRDYCLYAGISSPVEGIGEIHGAYYQAGAALEQAFRLQSDKWIMPFWECSLDHILRNLPLPLQPNHLIAPQLRELIEHDRERGTQYFETLRQYLLLERDIPKTSEALIIHRTTLLYRVKKIQTLLGLDLEDPWRRLQLLLSLWILEQEEHSL